MKHLQNRRDFFKEASEKMLPVLGLAILVPTPFFTSCRKDPSCAECSSSCSSSCSESSTNSGCSSCSTGCSSSCGEACSSGCGSSCAEACSRSCGEACSSNCSNECANECSSNCSNSANNSPDNTISEATGAIDGHDYVDLGLSVKWARCNVNASLPQKRGECKRIAFDSLYPYQQKDLLLSLGINGYPHHDKDLGGIADFDIATEKWGNNWRTPSQSEWEELKDNCELEAFELETVAGVKIKSRINGKSIFIPLSGRCSDTNIEDIGFYADLFSSTFDFDLWSETNHLIEFHKKASDEIEIKNLFKSCRHFVRAVTTGSGGGSTNCNGNCTNTAQNNCSSCQIGCSTGCSQQCSSNCSTGCKTTCSGTCPNGCSTLCGGSCNSSCGGTCSYVSSGSSCTSGTCATTCRNYCYRTCSLACSESCMSCCITSSK